MWARRRRPTSCDPKAPSTARWYFSTFAAEHAVWGAAAIGYHLTNLLLHALNALLLIELARRSGASEPAALLGAAVFALHPIQTEAVAYVAGRTDVLMTTGALASCVLLLGDGAPWRAASPLGWPAPWRCSARKPATRSCWYGPGWPGGTSALGALVWRGSAPRRSSP